MDTSNLIQVSREPGVIDLPLPVRRWFAKALLAERGGQMQEAQEYLGNALQAEADYRARPV